MVIFSYLVQTIEVFRSWGDLIYVIEILIIDDTPIFVAGMKFIVSFYNKDRFDTAFGITRRAMQIHGIWPGFSALGIRRLRYAFFPTAFMILFFINVPQTVMLFRLNGDLNAMLNILTLANVPIGIALAKLLGVSYNQEVLHQLIISISEDWKTTKKERELAVMWQKAKTSRLLSKVSMVLGEGTTLAYTVRMFYVLFNNEDSIKPLYFHGSFPYDTQSNPNYVITWVLQIIATLMSSGVFSAVDALFISFVLHLCGQLTNLQVSFSELGEKGPTEGPEFFKSIEALINKHRRINEFADIIEYSFNIMFLCQVFLSTLLLCLQGYLFVITITSGEIVVVEMVFMLYFTVCFTFSIFVYCYVAELLREEVVKLGTAIFYCKWYNLPAKEAKLLVVSLLRVNKPLEITAGKLCVFRLNLFCIILKTAAGYMSMLLAVRDKLA